MVTRDLVGDGEHKGCFMTNTAIEVAPHDKEVSDMICQNEQQIESAFTKAIEKGQTSGDISSTKDPTALARFILNNVQGMRVSAKSATDKRIFDDIIKLTLSVLD